MVLQLKIFGDVREVIEGNIALTRLEGVDMKKIAYALGCGVFEDEHGVHMGEGIVFDHKAYVFVPSLSWTNNSQLKTPFLMGFERKPDSFFQSEKEESLASLYGELMKKYPKGFGVVGRGHFSKLEVAFLKKNPVYHENVNELAMEYWEKESYDDLVADFVGVALPTLNKRAFYQNPNEKSITPFFSHTHALYKQSARHLFTQSTLLKADLFIEELGQLS